MLGLHVGAWCAYWGASVLESGNPLGPVRLDRASLLFVPLGVLWVAPWRESLVALPRAFAVARLGCGIDSCCFESWGWIGIELVGWAIVDRGARRSPHLAAFWVLGGLGALRIASLPFRATDELSQTVVVGVSLLWGWGGWRLRGTLAKAPDPGPVPDLAALARAAAWIVGVKLCLAAPERTGLSMPAALVFAAVVRARGVPFVGRRRARDAGLGLLAGVVLADLLAPQATAVVTGAGVRVASVLLIPVIEEVLYRERGVDALRTFAPPGAAVVVSATVFALLHDAPEARAYAFAGAVAVGAIRGWRGSLAAPIGLHAGWNLGVLS